MEKYTPQQKEQFRQYERDRAKRWYQRHEEEKLAYLKEYAETHKEELYYEKNKDNIKARQKLAYEKLKERFKPTQ